MSFQEKNITVTLVNFSLILFFFLIRVFQMTQSETFTPNNVFRLWGVVILLAVIVTIFATIMTHIVSAIIEAIRTKEEPDIEDIQDERDQLIDLKGTKVTYTVSSVGIFFAMASFAFGQSPLVMFSALIFVGVLAQIIGDIFRLYLYRRGF